MKQKRRHYSADEKAKISVVGQFPVTAFGRSRPAADASREVVERLVA